MYVPQIVQCSFNGRSIQARHCSGEIRYNSIMGEMVIMVKMVIMGEMVIMVKMANLVKMVIMIKIVILVKMVIMFKMVIMVKRVITILKKVGHTL